MQNDNLEMYARCTMGKVADLILTNVDKDNDYSSKEKAFIRYLYNTEFDRALVVDNKNTNVHIFLTDGFGEYRREDSIDLPLYDYIRNLRELLYTDKSSIYYVNGEKSENSLGLDEETLKILNEYREWRAWAFRKGYRNLKAMQDKVVTCSRCENIELNKIIASVVNLSEPIASSVFSYTETKAWPLAWRQNNRASFSVMTGYDVLEKAAQYSLVERIRIVPEFSIDMSFNHHDVGNDKVNDVYKSFNIGASYHFSSRLLPTLGSGYNYARKSNYYKESISGVYFSIGLLDELITFRYVDRLGNLVDYPGSYRRHQNVLFMFDLTKIIDILDKKDIFVFQKDILV